MSHLVEQVELIRARLPLVHSFATSSHRKGAIEHVLVRITDADGAQGWGECASPSDPYYGPENVTTCWSMLRDYLAPALIGRAWDEPGRAHAFGDRVRGNLFARAGLDIACWDLFARARGIAVADALGPGGARVEAGVSLGIEASVPALLEQVERFVAEGYRRVKLKIAPGWDVEPVAAVRERFGELPLQVDANGGYPAGDPAIAALDGFGLLMIEQPFAPDDLLAHARLQQAIGTPVCLDESIDTVGQVYAALRLGAMRVGNVKVSRLGGLGAARAVHDLCHAEGVPVWCGGMHEFGIGRAANLAVAALPGFVLPSDISGSDKYYERDVVTPPIRATEGLVPVNRSVPGLGVEVDADVLAAHTVETHTVRRDTDR